MGNKKKMTVLDFQKYKDEGRKFSFVTAYDYTTASIVNESDCEIILVGDSLGMIMLGYNTTVPVTVDDMIHHIRPVVKGAPDTFIIGDMPFGSYNVSKEQAIQDGRPTQRKGENVHFHDLGVEKMTRAIMSINEPTMTISTKTKDGNPAVIMMLPEYGNNNAPLYAVLSFYSRKTISPENRETRPHVVLTIAERNFFEEGGRYGWADVIKRAINEGTVIDFNKKERSSLSEVAQSVGLGDITDASLKKNLAQFQKEVKQFRESNNIRYQLKSATELEQEVRELTKYAAYRQRGTTDREILLSAAEGSVMTSAQSGKQLRRLSCFFARISPKSVRIPINKRTAFEIYTAPSRGSMLSAAADNITDSHRTAAPANAAVSADIRENFIPALRMPMAAANMSAEVAAARSISSVLSPPGSCYAAGDDCVTVKTFGRYAVKNIMMIKLVKGMITQWH